MNEKSSMSPEFKKSKKDKVGGRNLSSPEVELKSINSPRGEEGEILFFSETSPNNRNSTKLVNQNINEYSRKTYIESQINNRYNKNSCAPFQVFVETLAKDNLSIGNLHPLSVSRKILSICNNLDIRRIKKIKS